jgi:PAS domain S-box-containing protein
MQSQGTSSNTANSYRFTEGMIHCERGEDGRIVYVNQRFALLSGYEKGELIGKRCDKLLLSVNPKTVLSRIERRISESKRWEGLLRFLRKDGRYFWADTQVTPLGLQNREKRIAYIGRPADPDEVREKEREFELLIMEEKARN